MKYLDFSLDTCYGHVLSLWCATITLMISLDTCYGVGCELPVVKSACTRDSLFGLYTTGLSSLAVTGRLVSIEQGNCERNEGEFKVVKDALLSRSNFQLKHAFNVLRRHTLAKSITICTNTTACESSARVDTKLEDLRVSSSAALGIGPKPLDGRNGESRRFTEVQVRTATFVVAWLRWLPDYIVKGAGAGATNFWWKDDNADFTLPRSFMRMAGGASNLTGGGVRPTTILCDFSATTGAELFDAKWMTERDMEGALILHTRAIVQSPQDYSIPGWVSVEKALVFLKEEAGKEDRGPLSAFLRSAGVN